ncbi:MAG: STAS domain-containing protein [Burkholderiales bacterium]|nr:STAS domain-containing protein [Burkholderiales bacterium]MBK9348307.1 STAS domain-containing protein [Burkholderiales bacterium]
MGERFELPAELNIYNVLETRDTLLAWVAAQSAAGSERLEISASNVAEVDGAGLQLLAALSNMDHNWQLVGSSKNFTDACHAMGLVPWMDQHVPHANPTGVRA